LALVHPLVHLWSPEYPNCHPAGRTY